MSVTWNCPDNFGNSQPVVHLYHFALFHSAVVVLGSDHSLGFPCCLVHQSKELYPQLTLQVHCHSCLMTDLVLADSVPNCIPLLMVTFYVYLSVAVKEEINETHLPVLLWILVAGILILLSMHSSQQCWRYIFSILILGEYKRWREGPNALQLVIYTHTVRFYTSN